MALAGVSGAGKSTVGRLVADRLGVAFNDVDELIVAAEGRPITQLFTEAGEAYFREIEAACTRECLARGDVVVSLGGGAPTTAAVRDALEDADVVWLRVTPETAAARTGADPGRPLLAGRNPADALADLLARREAVYRSVADWIVDTDGLRPAEVADAVVALLSAEVAS